MQKKKRVALNLKGRYKVSEFLPVTAWLPL